MIPITAERALIVVDDPIAQLLLHSADADLMAPPRPRIVNTRCESLGERETFDALHYLTLLFKAVGRDDFTINDIHRYASGISRSRIPTYLRGLSEKGLIDVVGHREVKKLPKANWPARYSIDLDRLRKESAEAVVRDLWRENLPPPVRTAKPTDDQLELGLVDAPPAPPPSHGHGAPSSEGNTNVCPRWKTDTGLPHAHQSPPAMVLAAPSPYENGVHAPGRTDTGLPGTPSSYGNGVHAPGRTDTGLPGTPSLYGNGVHAPGRTDTGLPGATVLPEVRLPSSQGVVGGMWGGREGRGDVGEGETRTPTPDIRLMIQNTVHEVLATMGTATFAATVPHRRTDEPVPATPANEPSLDAGPITTWSDLSGRQATPADEAKIKEAVRRFERASSGHAAYWLTRAMTCVAIEEQAPLTISYASGILRRMQEQGDWSTEELHRRSREQRAESGSSAPKLDRVPRGKAQHAPNGMPTPQPAQATLTPELETHWAVMAWRQLAGPAVTITTKRAQQLIVQVTDPAAWEAVLTNWRVQYQAKANWAHFDGLLERYAREVSADRPAGTAPDAPHIPTTLIDHHPVLRDQELNRIWRGRFGDATSKPAKQAVLRRLLAEYPLSPELMAALHIPEQTPST